MNIPQIFPLSGMTCNNCVAKVTDRLLEHPDIASAEVILDPPEARIIANKALSDESMDEWLRPAGNYRVSRSQSNKEKHALEETSLSPVKDLQTYRPLVILSVYLLLGALAGAWGHTPFQWGTVMRLFMGGFFVAFSFFKMLDLAGFASTYRSYDLVARAVPAYGYVYPFIEFFLGLAYLANWQPFWINLITAIVMAVSLAGVLRAVLSKRVIKCACLGTVFNLPMSTVTIVEDSLMLMMALAALLKLHI